MKDMLQSPDIHTGLGTRPVARRNKRFENALAILTEAISEVGITPH